MTKRSPLFIFLSCFLTFAVHGQNHPLKVGDKPPKLDFKIIGEDSAAEALTWERLKNRIVIIDFWASWCSPCIKAFPHLNQLVKEFNDKPVTFLSITYEPEYMAKPFLAKHQLDTIIGIDNDFAMFRSYGAWAIPMVVIVNQKGRIVGVTHPNYLTNEVIYEVLAGKMPKFKPAKAWPDPDGAEEHFRLLIKPKQ